MPRAAGLTPRGRAAASAASDNARWGRARRGPTATRLAFTGVLALTAAAGLLVGCVPPQASVAQPAPSATMPPARSLPSDPQRAGRVDAGPTPADMADMADRLTAAVRADAAALLGLADASALTVTVQAVTWSDGSMGCPRPDVMYTQALVPGWLLQVSDGQRVWRYHASRSGAWVLCPAGVARPPLPRDATR